MNFPDLKPKYVTNIMIRRPYDARADALSYIMRVKVAEEGFVPPPVLGVKITEVGAMPAIKMLEAELEQKDLIPEVREAKTNLIRDLREALETSVMASLYEVGIDANALRYTAELNDALIKENRILKKKLEDEVTRVAVLYEEKDRITLEKATWIARSVKAMEKAMDITFTEFCNQMWPFFEQAGIDDTVKELWDGIREDIREKLFQEVI